MLTFGNLITPSDTPKVQVQGSEPRRGSSDRRSPSLLLLLLLSLLFVCLKDFDMDIYSHGFSVGYQNIHGLHDGTVNRIKKESTSFSINLETVEFDEIHHHIDVGLV